VDLNGEITEYSQPNYKPSISTFGNLTSRLFQLVHNLIQYENVVKDNNAGMAWKSNKIYNNV